MNPPSFTNQPAFCRAQDMDVRIDVPHVGEVKVTVAYGGMWYCIVDAAHALALLYLLASTSRGPLPATALSLLRSPPVVVPRRTHSGLDRRSPSHVVPRVGLVFLLGFVAPAAAWLETE